MQDFRLFHFLSEAAKTNNFNKIYGEAYELGTVLHVNDNSGAARNTNSKYKNKIASIRDRHDSLVKKLLPKDLAQKAMQASQDSGAAYLDSLETNHGMPRKDVTEVHHTHEGIDEFMGHKVNRNDNPHDLVVRGKRSFIHGASLKARKGTASNNGAGVIDSRIGADMSGMWRTHKKRAGVGHMTGDELKQVRDEPKIVAANDRAQKAVANHHAETFAGMPLNDQKKHLRLLMKGKPEMDYDYVVASNKGAKAIPHNKIPHLNAVDSARGFSTQVRNNVMHVFDHKGRHLAAVEHRPTHGSFSSLQVNTKYGSMKSTGDEA